METLHDIALRGASKICNCGNCFAHFECERKSWQKERASNFRDLPPFGKDTECHLKAYDVKQDTDPRPWWERSREETEVSEEELAALCEECQYTHIEGDYIKVNEGCFETHCMDCPVQGMKESIRELEAEAYYS